MNAMKFTGKALALCFAAGIAAAALCACGDKKTEEPAEQPKAQAGTQTAQPGAQTAQPGTQTALPGTQTALPADLQNVKPATEAEVLEILAFLPDPVATIDGESIPRKMIIDDIVSQGIPLGLLQDIGEERLREAMRGDIEKIVKSRLMLKLAKDAGYVPSAEFVAQEIRDEFSELSKEEQEDFEAMLKEDGTTLEDFIKEKSQDPDTQEIAVLRKYTHTTFLEKAKKEVSDADIRKEYESHIQDLTMPENITVAHILAQLDEDANEAADKAAREKIDAIYEELLKDPSQFDKLAQEKSDCPSGKRDSGKLPSFEKDGTILEGGRMDQTFTDAAYGIEKVGQITKPVKTQFGYHIIKLIEKTPEDVVPFEKVKDRITDFLVAEKAQAELEKAIDEAMKKYAKINDFAPAKPAEPKDTAAN